MHRVRRRGVADAANQRIEPGEVRNLDRRHRLKWLFTAATFAVGVALIAAACGGGGSNSTTTGSTSASGSSSSGKSFANFRIAFDNGLDYLDPGLSYTVQGWAIMWNVYLPLLGYKHVNGPDGATIVPYLAEALPTVSSDGKTYTLTLRKGIKYSNGATVQASDFRSTIRAATSRSTRRASGSSRTSSVRTSSRRRRPGTSPESSPMTRPARSRFI